MAKATNPSTTSLSRFHNVSNAARGWAHLLRIVETCVLQVQRYRRALIPAGRTMPDPNAWRVTRDGDVILPNRKIELRARPAARRMAAA